MKTTLYWVMITMETTKTLPDNFNQFIQEIAQGLDELYGPEAATQYQATANSSVQDTLSILTVRGLRAVCGGRTVGLLMLNLQPSHAQIFFIHVLKSQGGSATASRLVRSCVNNLRATGIRSITCEMIDYSKQSATLEFSQLGFTTIERAILCADLESRALRQSRETVTHVMDENTQDQGVVLLQEAYLREPGRNLHTELKTKTGTQEMVETVSNGGFGKFLPPHARYAVDGHTMAGIVLGSEVAPGVGFIVQVAVRAAYRNHGLGTTLIQELASEYRAEKLDRMALAVTLNNPAARLYERLGFTQLRQTDAYVWNHL